MTSRLRTDRMRSRAVIARIERHFRETVAEVLTLADLGPLPAAAFLIPPITDEQADEWQRAWDETVGEPTHRARIVTLPSRTVIRRERRRKSAPRGIPRMRKHTLPPPSAPEFELSDEPEGYVTDPWLTAGLVTYEQMRHDLGLDEPFTPLPKRPDPAESDFERLWNAAQRGDPDLVRAFNASLDRRPLPSVSIADLLGTPTEPWPPRGWLKHLYRRLTRKNGASS